MALWSLSQSCSDSACKACNPHSIHALKKSAVNYTLPGQPSTGDVCVFSGKLKYSSGSSTAFAECASSSCLAEFGVSTMGRSPKDNSCPTNPWVHGVPRVTVYSLSLYIEGCSMRGPGIISIILTLHSNLVCRAFHVYQLSHLIPQQSRKNQAYLTVS